MKKALRAGNRAVQAAILALIKAYRFALAPLMPLSCRFEPSCSAYALEAIRKHGPWRGSALAAWRILRCNPINPGGHDPVP
jgi:putative membrane protein insertion efficiency factor